jgi:hypothetical protein
MLRSIGHEIGERTRAIEELERAIESSSTKCVERARDRGLLVAELAHQRRELRFAKQELARFGCALDEDRPLRILIPGEDGAMTSGYAWNSVEDSLRRGEPRLASRSRTSGTRRAGDSTAAE